MWSFPDKNLCKQLNGLSVDMLVDLTSNEAHKGQVVLTGSQTYHRMQEVSESLAGRVGILELSSLSLREILGIAARGKYLPGKPYDAAAETVDVWQCMWRGTMPELQDPDLDWHALYSAYERSYLERDVKALLSVRDGVEGLGQVEPPSGGGFVAHGDHQRIR